MVVLIVANLLLAAAVVVVARRWWMARRAVAPLADAPAVTIRARGFHEEALERALQRALRDTGLDAVNDLDPRWCDPPPGVVRVAPPTLDDRAVVIEVAVGRVEDLLAGLVTALLDAGWEVSRTKGRKVTLRRSGLTARLLVAPA